LRDQNQNITHADCAEMRNNAEMPLLDNIGLAQDNDLTIFETLQNAEVCRIENQIEGQQTD
jgi:hypothetical protein